MWTFAERKPVVSHVPGPRVQAKLTIGAPNDKYEREADDVADRVMRMPAGRSVQRKCTTCANEDEVRRMPVEPEDDDERISAKAQPGRAPTMTAAAAAGVNQLAGGRGLSGSERAFFEPRFGHDFSRVQVFDNPGAHTAAANIGARAFTRGHRVAFAPSEYQPGSTSGRRLLAHELTHVIQQGGA